ncbi:hypothetical protein NDU88_007010 [Pleurodeles waltl]|uniref:Uncharacterized protein n=1 Tax=Pleurodeles waltl TaxID=8319 RepID=A0AAV7UNE3_PLEWA|nr:hypothetical protein NDU88_007010 [Pleurodeles waltl]
MWARPCSPDVRNGSPHDLLELSPPTDPMGLGCWQGQELLSCSAANAEESDAMWRAVRHQRMRNWSRSADWIGDRAVTHRDTGENADRQSQSRGAVTPPESEPILTQCGFKG